MSQPRHINTNRSARSSGAARPEAARANQARPAAGTGAPQSGNGAARTVQTAGSARPGRKKKKKIPVWLPLVVVLCIIGVGVGVVLGYVNSVLRAVKPDEETAPIAEEIKTAPEYQGDVVNVLICGIDYEEGRTYGSSSDGLTNDGMTDMILYFQFDVKQGKINMLQIPRNSVVGGTYTCTETTGKTYKASNGQINSIMKSNSDGVAALADVIYNMYKLPVDYYATIDMQALREIVDRFQGINVYIPFDIESGGSKLTQGYHTLMGDQVEFLVRNRHGSGYAQGDIARLNVQRYFYAALFKRVRTANLAELWKLLPVVTYYVKTDMPGEAIVALAYNFLSVESSNIMIAQTPVCSGPLYKENSIVVPDGESIAELLNTYYRAYMDDVPASGLNLFEWEKYGAPTSANVQVMGQLDEEREQYVAESGTDVVYDY